MTEQEIQANKIIVSVTKHAFLDCSVGWFVRINGTQSGGEITSEREAIEIAKHLAEKLGGEFKEEIRNTNEMFT